MAVHRADKKKNNYTCMGNYHLRDTSLSLKAIGLLSKILSLSDDWDYSLNGLIAICKEDERSVKNALNELKERGYVKVTKIPPQKGINKIQYKYDIYEEPLQAIQDEEVQNEEIQDVKVQDVDIQNEPIQNVGVQNEPIQNAVQLNTNKLNTNKLNTKELNTNNKILKNNISSKAADEISSYEFNILKNEFEDLWSKYPKKRGKKEAFEIYCKYRKATNESYITKDDVEDGIEQYNRYIKAYAIENKYIKYGSTFFEERAWEDDYEIDNQKSQFTEWLEEHQYSKLA